MKEKLFNSSTAEYFWETGIIEKLVFLQFLPINDISFGIIFS
jgi:hypothetical protein